MVRTSVANRLIGSCLSLANGIECLSLMNHVWNTVELMELEVVLVLTNSVVSMPIVILGYTSYLQREYNHEGKEDSEVLVILEYINMTKKRTNYGFLIQILRHTLLLFLSSFDHISTKTIRF